jgi:hypothetical protein
LLIDKNARAFVADALHGKFKLLAAIAAQRTEYVTGEALRVDADDGRPGVDVTEHEGNAAFDATRCGRITGPAWLGLGDDTFEAVDAEMSPARGEVGLRYLGHGD